MNWINTWITSAGFDYYMTEFCPDNPTYKRWATRSALAKYQSMGLREFTKWDAK